MTVPPDQVAKGGEGKCDAEFETCLKVRASIAVKRNLEQAEEYANDAYDLCKLKVPTSDRVID